jgi:protein-S-isoprenylcysteine O-methyltransferase Ste14
MEVSMQLNKLLPPTYVYIAIVLILVLHFALPGAQLLDSPWRYVGILPLLVGIALNLLADQAFKQHNTTVKPFETSTTLVTGGVFRFTRNPMYLGFVLLLTGIAILLGSLTPWIVVVAFPFLMDMRFVRAEEAMLEARFGDSWLEYKRRVGKWL